MNPMRFRYSLLTLAALVASACAPAAAPSPTALPAKPAAPAAAPPAVPPAATVQAKTADKAPATSEFYEAAKKEGTVVIYGLGGVQFEPAEKAFEARYPGVDAQGQDQRGRESREKIIAEQSARRVIADVVSGGPDTTTALVQEGFIEAYKSAALQYILPEALDPRGFMSPRTLNVYGIMINTNVIPPADEPKRWLDLTDPKYRGKIAIQDPRGSGGGATVLQGLLKLHGEDFIRKLGAQNVFIGSDNAQIITELVRGEHGIMMSGTVRNTLDQTKKGAPLKVIRPEEGVAITPISVSVVKNAPHPNAAKLFIDWILSEEGQKVVAEAGDTPSRIGIQAQFPEADLRGQKILPRDEGEAGTAIVQERDKLYESVFFKKS